MRNKKNIISFVVIIIFFVVGFFLIKNNHYFVSSPSPLGRVGEGLNNIKFVKLAGQNIKVDLAVTDEARRQGLSGRSGLGENEGMLFIFDKPDKYYFWMKDMNFPIDMIWVTEDMKVIYIQKNAPPEAYPETYGPDANTKYVLEVVSGFSDKNNLKIGDSVLFTY
ncbi:MAG: DUF192 domain-containing protein [bacterium]